MPVDPVTNGDVITEAWGDSVSTSVNALEADVTTLEGTAPTAGEKAALAGSSGAPGAGNKYVTDADARNTNARTPSAHGTNHNPGAADPVTTAIAGASAVGDTAGAGAAASLARSDHRHSRESFGSPVAIGDTNADGAATTVPRSDHVHGDGWTYVRKTANQDVTNSSALVNDSELSFAAAAGQNYEVEVGLHYVLQSGTAADIKVAFGEDATARGVMVVQAIGEPSAALNAAIFADQTTVVSLGATTANRIATGRGTYRGNGGTFRVRWAQNTATSGVYTRMLPGSYLRYRALGAANAS